MKIWCQSSSSIGASEVFKDYYESLQRHAKRVCRPDTVCEFHGQDKTFPGVDHSRAAWYLAQGGAIRNAIRAEKQGFDAYAMISTNDAGFCEIREVVDIPIVFITQASLHFALLLAPNFAFVAHNALLYDPFPEMAARYGLKEQMIPGGCLDISYKDFGVMWQKPEPYIEAFNQKAREVVARGATLLFPVALPLSQWLIDQNIREVDGATILDPLFIALKTAEIMVDLEKMGIRGSRRCAYAIPCEDIREALRKEFNP